MLRGVWGGVAAKITLVGGGEKRIGGRERETGLGALNLGSLREGEPGHLGSWVWGLLGARSPAFPLPNGRWGGWVDLWHTRG